MDSTRKASNPFYVLLVLAGILFCVTACAYGVMTVRHLNESRDVDVVESDHPLLRFLDEYGFPTIIAELAVLGLTTVLAIVTDVFWSRRAGRRARESVGSTKKLDEL